MHLSEPPFRPLLESGANGWGGGEAALPTLHEAGDRLPLGARPFCSASRSLLSPAATASASLIKSVDRQDVH